MLEVPHILIGAAIATAFPNPIISLPSALISHFVADSIPHWNPQIHIELKEHGEISKTSKVILITDFILALIVSIFFAVRVLPNWAHSVTILSACLLSVIPDLIQIPHYIFRKKIGYIDKFIIWQAKLQSDTSLPLGLITQILVSAISLTILLSH